MALRTGFKWQSVLDCRGWQWLNKSVQDGCTQSVLRGAVAVENLLLLHDPTGNQCVIETIDVINHHRFLVLVQVVPRSPLLKLLQKCLNHQGSATKALARSAIKALRCMHGLYNM